jgi:sulfite reductase alpha subunit-like flavoprotein
LKALIGERNSKLFVEVSSPRVVLVVVVTMRDTRLLILYASETGNSEDCAELLGRQGKARGFRSIRVLPADRYASTSIEQLPNEEVLVFVASTAGQGEFPRNGRALWKFLRRKSLPSNLLQSVRFAVFGLGDSGYPKYNYCAKLLHKRFETLGGQSVVPLGLGDDQHAYGYDASLDLWMPKLWESLGVSEIVDVGPLELAPKFAVEVISAAGSLRKGGQEVEQTGDAGSSERDRVHEVGQLVRMLESPLDKVLRERSLLSAEVVSNTRVTPADWFQDTRLLKLNLEATASAGPLDPGDAVAIWPEQDAAAVHRVLDVCELGYDDVVRLRLRDVHAQGPNNIKSEALHPLDSLEQVITCKAGHLLEGFVDVQGAPPRRTFIQAMAQLCPTGPDTAMYKERLTHLASANGREDFYDYVMQEGRNIAEVLADFSCVPMTLDWLLSFAPRLQCRYYSMASVLPIEERTGTAAVVTTAMVDLLAAMVQWKTPGRRLRRGLCSRMIAELSPGDRITVSLTPGELQPPPLSVPMILVGPGTGIAPLRSFLQDRQRWASQGAAVAPSVLFYGCRDRTKDFYFADEWRGMVENGVLREVVLATSRESSPKQYVQDAIKERGDLVRELILAHGAHVYVCGRADSMPSSVERVLGELLGGDRKLLSRICHFECW